MIPADQVLEKGFNDDANGRRNVQNKIEYENKHNQPINGIGVSYGENNLMIALEKPSIWLTYIMTVACMNRHRFYGLDEGKHFPSIIQSIDREETYVEEEEEDEV